MTGCGRLLLFELNFSLLIIAFLGKYDGGMYKNGAFRIQLDFQLMGV